MRLKFSGVIILLSVFMSCSSQNYLETDEEVINEINKISEFKVSKEDVCIIRPKSFEHLILVGFFAHDRGCGGSEGFYKGEKVNFYDISEQVFADNNWSDESKRLSLIQNWIKEVYLVWESIVDDEPENFSKHSKTKFHIPEYVKKGEQYTASFWVQEPAGMMPINNYKRIELVFSDKGLIISSKTTDNVSIEIKTD